MKANSRSFARVAAISLDARAFSLRESNQSKTSRKGITISVACGILMGHFVPLLPRPRLASVRSALRSCICLLDWHCIVCTRLVMIMILMARPISGSERVRFSRYLSARPFWHMMGLLGGAIWCTGLVFNFIASHAQIVGPAVSCAIGQGATMVSAIWEFSCGGSSPARLRMQRESCSTCSFASLRTRYDCSRAAVSLILRPGDCF